MNPSDMDRLGDLPELAGLLDRDAQAIQDAVILLCELARAKAAYDRVAHPYLKIDIKKKSGLEAWRIIVERV